MLETVLLMRVVVKARSSCVLKMAFFLRFVVFLGNSCILNTTFVLGLVVGDLVASRRVRSD